MNEQRTCWHRACERADLAGCEYVDRHGDECVTRWCPEHLQSIHGATVCRRHAGVLRSLGAQPASALPELDNRAPALVNWVFRDIEFALRALLATDGRIEAAIADANVHVSVNDDGTIIWQQSLISGGHPSHSVTVAVDESKPTLVSIRVDRRSVLEAEPPWITRRLGRAPADSDPHRDDARFFSMIRVQVADRLSAPLEVARGRR